MSKPHENFHTWVNSKGWSHFDFCTELTFMDPPPLLEDPFELCEFRLALLQCIYFITFDKINTKERIRQRQERLDYTLGRYLHWLAKAGVQDKLISDMPLLLHRAPKSRKFYLDYLVMHKKDK